MSASMSIDPKKVAVGAAATVNLLSKSKYPGQDPLFISMAKLLDDWGDWFRQENIRLGFSEFFIRTDRLCKIFDNPPMSKAAALVGFSGMVGHYAHQWKKKLLKPPAPNSVDKRTDIEKLHSNLGVSAEATGAVSFGCVIAKILNEVEVIFLSPAVLEGLKKVGKHTGKVSGYLKSAVAVMEFGYCLMRAIESMSLTVDNCQFTADQLRNWLPGELGEYGLDQINIDNPRIKKAAIEKVREEATYKLLLSLIGVATAVASFYITWRVGRLQVFQKRIDLSVVFAKTVFVAALTFELYNGKGTNLIGNNMPQSADAAAISMI